MSDNYGMTWPISLWSANDSMVSSARANLSVGSSAYDELPQNMTEAPGTILKAYEQATYFVALGARRAMRENNAAASDYLLTELDRLLDEEEAVQDETNWLCSLVGVGCPKGGSGKVLQEAIEVVEDSGLNPDDMVQITSILSSNRRSFLIKQAIPAVVAVGAGVALGVWWRRRKQRS